MNALTSEGILADMDCAAGWLRDASQLGVVGFCLGGAIALYADAVRHFGASVTFTASGYSNPEDDPRCPPTAPRN